MLSRLNMIALGVIATAPAFPNAKIADTTQGAEAVSYYLASPTQGFIVETDTVAPVTGVVEAQDPTVLSQASLAAKHARAQPARPLSIGPPLWERRRRDSECRQPELCRRGHEEFRGARSRDRSRHADDR